MMTPVSESVTRIAYIGIAGGIGCILRYLVSGVIQTRSTQIFPIGTLVANTLGCLAIGYLAVRFEATLSDPNIRAAVLVGLLGGFTTFSTFSLETLKLAQNGQMLPAAANIIASLVCCLAGVWVGQRIATWTLS
jgi:CrcB protein